MKRMNIFVLVFSIMFTIMFMIMFTIMFMIMFTPITYAEWKDPVAPGKQSVIFELQDRTLLRIDVLANNLFRVRRGKTDQWTESGMNRYGILKSDFAPVAFTHTNNTIKTSGFTLNVDGKSGDLRLKSAVSSADVSILPALEGKGFTIRFGLTKDERIYGLGDSSRDNIMRRSGVYEMWVRNNLCNIPVPMALSCNGWGMLLNSTWRNVFDVGKGDPNAMICKAPEGNIDFYVFTGRDYRELLDTYTQLAGRPALLPVWGYGFTFVCNQNIDQFNLVNDAMRFREMKLPCDVIGLEPGWMQKFYDLSTKKAWNKERFYFPYWAPKGEHTFTAALKRKGFKLSLWLCCDYDLSRYEEQLVAGKVRASGGKPVLPKGITETWTDDRIGNPDAATANKTKSEDTYPEGSQPWFEHLKKFVDQGAACFKLDGCNQFGEHPNRKWENGMKDEEMHNLYPDIYDKQMSRGFEDYTKRRSMVYSAGGYAGVQQYVATWAGDTGGGAKPLVSLLNLAYSGHSNQSCDMSISNIESLHFGFLQTWSQQNNWDYWYQPWLLQDEKISPFREYANLRYRLMPYLYTMASDAARTGWPVMRALTMVYPEVPEYDKCQGEYLLGDSLLVSAFVETAKIPTGLWYDWWTGETIQGPCDYKVKVTDDHGGALLVKAGAIIPTWPIKQYVERGWNERVEFQVYPSAAGTFTLYEDDGTSLEYKSGKFALTKIECKPLPNGNTSLVIGARSGSYNGMPKSRDFSIVFHVAKKPLKVLVDNTEVQSEWNETSHTVTVVIGACGEKARECLCVSPGK